MISLENFGIAFGGRDLYKEINLLITPSDRVGLVGINGSGKSTLLKSIAGKQAGYTGKVIIGKDTKVGYLPQEMVHDEDETIFDEASKAFAELKSMEKRLDEVNHALATRTDYESNDYLKLIEEVSTLSERLHLLGDQEMDGNIAKVLVGLGFRNSDFTRKMKEFSGGWKMRVELAKILLARPDIILLDEPTNHLDIDSIEWLEDFLKNGSSGIVLISHDRQFLDNVTNRTLDIRGGKILDYKFSFSKYEEQREIENRILTETYENQQKVIAHTEKLIDKFRAKQSKASFAQSLIKKLDRMDKVELDSDESTAISIRFPAAPRSGKFVVSGKGLGKAYGDKRVFSDIDILIPRGEKVALIGKNGVGKSTLVRMITGNEDHEGEFEKGHNIAMSYFAQDEADKLDKTAKVFDIVDREAQGDIRKQLRGLLGAFLFSGDDINKKVSVLSGGEKTRLALCRLLLKPTNLLILDEPTNHLDMKSKDVLKQALQAYDGALLVISHDREFLKGLTNRVLELTPERIKDFPGDIMEFLKNRQAGSIAVYEHTAKRTDKAPVKTASTSEKKNPERDKKQIETKLKKVESEIEKNESEQARFSDLLQNVDYSDTENVRDLSQKLEWLKSENDRLMSEWEQLQSAAEEL
jgi:ATP-binding cassette, subfamily F, member 3